MEQRRQRAAELYLRYGPVVYRRCLRLLRDKEAARDATQEIFVKLIQHMEKLERLETVIPWIFRVATNHCLNQRRSVRRHGEEPFDPDRPGEGWSGAGFGDRQLAQQVLARFDSGTQAVAVGVLVEGMEHEEVAEALGISRRTVARRLARFIEGARQHLGLGGSEP